MALKFLKWVEIIKAESEAVKRNAMYVLQKDAETCDVIFIDSKGRKRKASGLTLPQIENQLARIDAANIDATAQEQWRSVLNLYTKAEVDDITGGLSRVISDEANLRESADTSLQQSIDAETQARIAGDNNLAQNHSDLQAIVNALQTWKDAMTNADADSLVNTLNELLQVMQNVPEGTNIYAVLASKVNTADIVNNLTSSLTNAPLSAYQGSVLKGLVDNLQTAINNEASARANADNLKLDKTTTTVAAPDATYKYVYIMDENSVPRRMLAGDLGKNIANSSLTSVANAGLTLGANWTLNTSGYYFNITNLPNKSSDTSFNTVLTQNSAGQVAKSNGWNVMQNAMSIANDAQKDAWRLASRKTDETYSTGLPTVDLVLPFQIYKGVAYNFKQYVTIIGTNLYIDPANSIIRIEHISSGQTWDMIPIVQQGLPSQCAFGINTSTFPTGVYRIAQIVNGIGLQTNPSQVTFEIVETIVEVPFNINQSDWVVNKITTNPAYNNLSTDTVGINEVTFYRHNVQETWDTLLSTVESPIIITPEQLQDGFMAEFSIEYLNANRDSIIQNPKTLVTFRNSDNVDLFGFFYGNPDAEFSPTFSNNLKFWHYGSRPSDYNQLKTSKFFLYYKNGLVKGLVTFADKAVVKSYFNSNIDLTKGLKLHIKNYAIGLVVYGNEHSALKIKLDRISKIG